MTTKKADKVESRQRLERGRFAKTLAGGYTIEVVPSSKGTADKSETPKPVSRPSKT